MKILIFGASGSGTTTLGKAIEKETGFVHLDVDDYYWRKTEPLFVEKVPLQERNEHLKQDFEHYDHVVMSGSMVSWGKEWEVAFDLAIFLYLDNEERMDRLQKRENERYGNLLETDQEIQKNSKAFLQWANRYENDDFEGRSLKIHKNWMKKLDCPVLQIDGSLELPNKVHLVMTKLKTI
ncbi:AAA family ATPase [Aquimarina spongiae]|uniref:Adenylate kinase n=1 Tax=Aquimarina spongiae TaxID=570521 RepID=A0A1M6IRK0_9FLAO|nr:AAA family ATPase [Aquimarina spongiae]SHJ37140.1 Adenylate kinase [Aquimarina spongiae]